MTAHDPENRKEPYARNEEIRRTKETYLPGMRVELVKMDDPQAPPVGTKGTVRMVDDIGSVCISWDNGSSLNAVLGEDVIRIIKTTGDG